jgi:hypothetical protein
MSHPLTEPLLDTLRLVRQLHRKIDGLREALCAAFDLVADRDAELAAAQNVIVFQRAQVRAAVSGRTIAEERQLLERETLDQGNRDVFLEVIEHGEPGPGATA